MAPTLLPVRQAFIRWMWDFSECVIVIVIVRTQRVDAAIWLMVSLRVRLSVSSQTTMSTHLLTGKAVAFSCGMRTKTADITLACL